MTRIISVFTLYDLNTLKEVKGLLEQVKEDLPETSRVQVFAYSDEGMPELLPGMFFGDIVQLIDCEYAWQASEFPESEAYKKQQKRVAKFVTNTTSLSYTYDENLK